MVGQITVLDRFLRAFDRWCETPLSAPGETERYQAMLAARDAVDINTVLRGGADGADGTERLCRVLYGEDFVVPKVLGGSNAAMLHDAADEVEQLRRVQRIVAEVDDIEGRTRAPVRGTMRRIARACERIRRPS